ncbi:unnamed protein product [Ixodes pacificus]
MLYVALVLLGLLGLGRSQCSTNGFFPHESQCDGYYECRNGTVHQGLCPDGLVFNDDAGHKYLRCDLPFSVNCENRPYLQPAQAVGNCPRRWGMYADPSDCGKFVNCVGGKAHKFDCPEGLAFNDQRGICDWPDLVERCDAEAYLGFQCPEATSYDLQDFANPPYPHPRDCAKHFVCVASYYGKRLPRLLSCDYGLVFNPTTRTCDDPLNVHGCENYYGAREEPVDQRQTLRRQG